MQCPIDRSELVKRIYEANVEIDECPQCKGVWLDEGELEKIQEISDNDYSDELKKMPDYIGNAFDMAKDRREENRVCPKCNQSMDRREYGYCSQVMIDVCPSCRGIWLDNHELQKLEIFYEKSRVEANELKSGFLSSLLNMFK
ncbi:MAG: hypothetical protein Kow00108_23280 [Calditrichia bacterium]